MKRYRTLNEIYAAVPVVRCVGRCAKTCTVIPMSNVERQRVATRGVIIPLVDVSDFDPLRNTVCPALDADRRCTVYDVRPLICRMYGAVEDILCPFGCEVEGEILTAEQGHELLAAAREIGNGSTVKARRRQQNLKKRRK